MGIATRRSSGSACYPVAPHCAPAAVLAVHEPGPDGAPKPRLLDRVREAIRARHYGRRTYILFHTKRHPAEMGGDEVTRFLTSLAVPGRVAASTQNQALSALLFLYREVLGQDLPWLDDVVRAKRHQRLPVVLTRDEVCAVIERIKGVPRLMALLMYGAGLRLLECARLRLKDVDFTANQLVVRTLDLQHGAGWVELPYALARKYPNAGREWGWQWVFPATRIYTERTTASTGGTTSTNPCSNARSGTRSTGPASPSPRVVTPGRQHQIYTHVLNRGPSGFASPADLMTDL